MTAATVSQQNRQEITVLKTGMSRQEVLSRLGEKTVLGYSGEPNLKNPHDVEVVHDRDGRRIEVLYFVTTERPWDGQPSAADLTPLSFFEDKLVGRSWKWLKENVQKYRRY